jgi:penicillin amidase
MYVAAGKVHAAHNFYWIVRDGNIAYFHSGKWPIKPTTGRDGRPIDDRLPLWGTGEEEWVGVTGVKEMPKCYNPSQGYLANWNNKPVANWPFGESDASWGQGHRVGRIQELLAADDDITFEDMNRIVRDAGYNHIPGMNLLDFLVDAAKTDPTISSEVVDYLEAWDHHYNDYIDPMWPAVDATYDDPGLTIFDDWYSRIFDEVFEDDLPTYAEVGPIHREYARVWPSTIIHVFNGPDAKLELNYDYLNGEDRDEVICRVLKWSIGNLTDDLGPDMSIWLTPVIQWWPSQLGALPRAPMHYMNRGTYNHIAEMIVWDYSNWRSLFALPHAVNVIPPGQSDL